jgi:hypothetical protein
MIRVSLACNSPDTGHYLAAFSHAEFRTDDGDELELVYPYFRESSDGYSVDVEPIDIEMHRVFTESPFDCFVVIGFHRFPTSAWHLHAGNWCWDECSMLDGDALALIRQLLAMGFVAESGTDGLFEEFGP